MNNVDKTYTQGVALLVAMACFGGFACNDDSNDESDTGATETSMTDATGGEGTTTGGSSSSTVGTGNSSTGTDGATATDGSGTDGTGESGTSGEVEFDPQLAVQLQAVLAASKAEFGFVAGSVGIRRPDGSEWTSSIGLQSLQSMMPSEIGNQSKIGSISKTFTATVILKLIEQGQFRFEDQLNYLLSNIGGSPIPDAWKATTVRELLYHTSGVPNYVKSDAFGEGLLADPTRIWQPEELLAFVFDEPMTFPPGTAWEYSNSGYILLALVAEEVTGLSIESLVYDWVLEPAELKFSAFPRGVDVGNSFNHGYLDGWVNAEDNNMLEAAEDSTSAHPSASWCAGAIVSTIPDLLNWGETLAAGSLLTPEMQAQRTNWIPICDPKTAPGCNPTVIQFGLGLVLDNGFLGHQGGIWGYESIVMHREGTTITVLTSGTIGSRIPPGVSVSRDIFLDSARALGFTVSNETWRPPSIEDSVAPETQNGTKVPFMHSMYEYLGTRR